ncbi:MAG: hypothetical protein HOP95_11125 [Sphingomonas sp.]|nr:hypothetical protein [Sphingomonas sp.]
MAIAHDLRELPIGLAEIAICITDLALALLETLANLLDILVALTGKRARTSLPLGPDRVHVDLLLLLLLEPSACVELRPSSELLLLPLLHPLLRGEHRGRALAPRLLTRLLTFFTRLLTLFVQLLLILLSLLMIVVGPVAGACDRRARRGARQQQGNEDLTHDSDLSKT